MENKPTLYLVQLNPEKVCGSRWKDTKVGLRFNAYIISTMGESIVFSLVPRSHWYEHKADVIVPLDWIKWMAPAQEEEHGLILEKIMKG